MSVGKIVVRYLKKHRLLTINIVFIILIVSALAIVPAQILRYIVDDIIPSKSTALLLSAAVWYTISYVVIGLVGFLKDIIMLSTSQKIIAELKNQMMRYISQITYQELTKNDSGNLEAYFSNDVITINELFTTGVVNIATDLFKMIGIVISIFIYSLTFGLIVLAILPILVLFTFFVKKQMHKAQLMTKTLEGGVNSVLLENVENIEQIKVNKAEAYGKDKYAEILNNHFKVCQTSNFYDAVFSPIMHMIRNIVICAVLLISGVNPNFFGMTIGMIVAAISLLTDLFSPIENLGMEIQTIQKSLAAIERIDHLFKIPINPKTYYQTLDSVMIEYQDVNFAYEDTEVINHFNLVIHEGEKIALQGPSGSGKSTLLKLALGLIQPQQGQVLIGGMPIFQLDEQMRQELFAIVYQDPFFSGGTIYEEITLLNKAITKEEVQKALNQVGLDYITNLDMPLNEKEYSSGELALFNIARVVVRNAKVIFLDEMNAKIDPVTARSIIALINKIAIDKIVISINHYGDTLDNAKIIYLK